MEKEKILKKLNSQILEFHIDGLDSLVDLTNNFTMSYKNILIDNYRYETTYIVERMFYLINIQIITLKEIYFQSDNVDLKCLLTVCFVKNEIEFDYNFAIQYINQSENIGNINLLLYSLYKKFDLKEIVIALKERYISTNYFNMVKEDGYIENFEEIIKYYNSKLS